MGKYQKKSNPINSVLIVLILVIAIVLPAVIATGCQKHKHKEKIKEINAAHEQEIINLRSELQEVYETQIADLKQFYEYGGDVTQIEKEAECIAKLFYGMDRNHEDSYLRAIAWCVFNRVEDHAHPDTVIGVCEQPKQWIGYSPDNPVLTEHYELALAELKIWHSNGHRPVGKQYIYLTWSSKEILLRDTFEENKNTHYWRMQ